MVQFFVFDERRGIAMQSSSSQAAVALNEFRIRASNNTGLRIALEFLVCSSGDEIHDTVERGIVELRDLRSKLEREESDDTVHAGFLDVLRLTENGILGSMVFSYLLSRYLDEGRITSTSDETDRHPEVTDLLDDEWVELYLVRRETVHQKFLYYLRELEAGIRCFQRLLADASKAD